MNSSAEDIKDMLETYYSSTEALYSVFVGREPAEPANTITIFETHGTHQLTFDKDEIYEYPSVQIRIRSTSYTEGWQIAESIKTILHGRANETWNGAFYTLIRCISGPFLLDYDKNQRVRFVVNFYLQRR